MGVRRVDCHVVAGDAPRVENPGPQVRHEIVGAVIQDVLADRPASHGGDIHRDLKHPGVAVIQNQCPDEQRIVNFDLLVPKFLRDMCSGLLGQ